MKIYYLGNQIAGLIGRMTILVTGHEIVDKVDDCDVLLSVHHRKIILREIFEKPKMGAINVHPYLYCYPGKDPVGRAIADENWHGSVGCHHITELVDSGEVVKELFIDIIPSENRCEIYNQLYPVYSQVILESLKIIEEQYYDMLGEPDILVGGSGEF